MLALMHHSFQQTTVKRFTQLALQALRRQDHTSSAGGKIPLKLAIGAHDGAICAEIMSGELQPAKKVDERHSRTFPNARCHCTTPRCEHSIGHASTTAFLGAVLRCSRKHTRVPDTARHDPDGRLECHLRSQARKLTQAVHDRNSSSTPDAAQAPPIRSVRDTPNAKR